MIRVLPLFGSRSMLFGYDGFSANIGRCIHELVKPKKKYTRAFVMDMLGSVMFPDKSDDQVAVMYLQFLGDMDTRYNWGQAVLAFLYRQLYMASHVHVKSMAGPLMLLQQWAWTRFPIGRPESGFSLARLGASVDPRKRLAFGMKWCEKYMRWPRNPHGGKLSKLNAQFS